jgi:hypothetical protein
MNANANIAPVSEAELRAALRQRLQGLLDQEALLIEELGIENGTARIDMAVIADGISGYEIKSDFDSDQRLYNQIHRYNRVFEHIYIVTGPLSGKEIEPFLPSWWGIMRASRGDDGVVTLQEMRAPSANQLQDPFSLLEFLKREELNQLGVQHELPPKVLRGAKRTLIATLATLLSLDAIREAVVQFLRLRAIQPSVVL